MKRLSGKGPLSPSIKEHILPDNVKVPVVVFSLSLVLFSTITPTGGERPPVADPSVLNPGPASGESISSSAAPPADPFAVETSPIEEAVESLPPRQAAPEEVPAPVDAPGDHGRVLKPRKAAATQPWVPANITRGPMDKMLVSLTFDGGYNAEEAGEVLDILRAKGVKTTIFLTGVFMKRSPEITRRIAEEGHEVGNHMMTHPHLTEYARNYTQRTLAGVDREFVVRELQEAERLYRKITGREMAPLWRAPYGEVNSRLIRWAFEAGYVHVGWTSDYSRRESLDTLDWVSDRTSRLYLTAGEIKQKVLNFGSHGAGARGGIILMHLGTRRTTDKAVTMMDSMIDHMRAGGYGFVKVSELIARRTDGARALKTARNLKRERLVTGLTELDTRPSGIN